MSPKSFAAAINVLTSPLVSSGLHLPTQLDNSHLERASRQRGDACRLLPNQSRYTGRRRRLKCKNVGQSAQTAVQSPQQINAKHTHPLSHSHTHTRAAYLPLPTDQRSAAMHSESHALACHASNIVAKRNWIRFRQRRQPCLKSDTGRNNRSAPKQRFPH